MRIPASNGWKNQLETNSGTFVVESPAGGIRAGKIGCNSAMDWHGLELESMSACREQILSDLHKRVRYPA